MRTSKPIATISYNSPEFLYGKLKELVRAHTISDFCFIKHYAEEDERKDHIHVWIKPNRLLDTIDLQEALREFDPEHPDKPFGCIDFVSSQIDDFILYGLHLEEYLAYKCESRAYHYSKDDFVFNDSDTFEDLYHHALKGSKFATERQRLELINSGVAYNELIQSGTIPLSLSCHLNALDNMQRRNHTYRNGRSGHDLPTDSPVKVDAETGEILDASFDADNSLDF